jgi:Zn-finger nucleic acid-binding protein
MKCPVDNTTLVMSDRQGIEINYCPECRGVWLDRGEIDKIIDRTSTQAQHEPTNNPTHYAQPHNDYASRRDYDDDDEDHRPHSPGHDQKHHRKESWFGDLFG